jgi:hypothetical protein
MKCHGVNSYHIGDGQVGQANQSEVVSGLDNVTFNITEITTGRIGVKLQQNMLECLPCLAFQACLYFLLGLGPHP